ncbi:MAG: nucleotidyl transferase [uncultured bacterium]|nr:MAG: nucleotidyl transferase [uncultured bacterium]
MIDYHLEKKGICTIACYEEKNISSKGMVVFDEDNKITSFVEKPTKEKIISNYANAGIYVFDKKIFDYLSTYTRIPFDIGHDLFSYNLIENENVFAYLMDEYLLDIGTLETYDIANKQISKLIF